jgi:hypothetical protein
VCLKGIKEGLPPGKDFRLLSCIKNSPRFREIFAYKSIHKTPVAILPGEDFHVFIDISEKIIGKLFFIEHYPERLDWYYEHSTIKYRMESRTK